MSDSPDDSRNGTNKKSGPAFKFSFDGEAGDAVSQGMHALKTVLGGFVKAVKEAIGPEGIRNLEASQWLAQVATCLEAVAKGLCEHGKVPTGKVGELTCFLDRISDEIRGSKFESQLPSLRQRLEDAFQLAERISDAEDADVSEQDINRLSNAAGYFNAAAASVAISGKTNRSGETPS